MNQITEQQNQMPLSGQGHTGCDFLLEHLSLGIVLFTDEGILIYCNPAAINYLDMPISNVNIGFVDLFTPEETELLENSLPIERKNAEKVLHIQSFNASNGRFILIHDKTNEASLKQKLDNSSILNRELQKMFELYADDSIYVTDGEGMTIHVGGSIASNCGMSIESFKGKNVRSLEKDQVFYPSVSVKVLESLQPEVVLQKTRIGKTLVSVGVPFFNEQRNLVKIISVTRDISKQLSIGNLISSIDDSSSPKQANNVFPELITCHDEFFSIIELIRLIAVVNTTVLIFGETGTGKNVAAKLIHKLSHRSKKPYLAINCGAISPNLIESELFGYEPGTFTGGRKEGKIGMFEAAHSGTLVLDEVSELPLEQQVKLLQVLQEKQITRVGGTKTLSVDIRFIATSNKNLEKLVDEGRFRKDLYYRLNVVPISIPPLRQRKEDVPLLAKQFLNEFNHQHHKNKEFLKDTLVRLCDYDWPGNVRELENLVERLVVTLHKPVIELQDLPDHILNALKSTENADKQPSEQAVSINEILPLKLAVELTERKLIQKTLEQYKTATKVAEILKVNQSTISRKIRMYGLQDAPIYDKSDQR